MKTYIAEIKAIAHHLGEVGKPVNEEGIAIKIVSVTKGVQTVRLLMAPLTTRATNAADTHISPSTRRKRNSQMGSKTKWRPRVGTPSTTVNIYHHERHTQILVFPSHSERRRARRRSRRNPCPTISKLQRRQTRRTRQQPSRTRQRFAQQPHFRWQSKPGETLYLLRTE